MSSTKTETPKAERTSIGVVESDKNAKTRRVALAFQQRHPKYGKYLKERTIVYAHDEKNESRVGDRVEIEPCRPMSATKRFRLVRVITKAPVES
ncbi:MAG TPA: 30S ribosomal protein S17 [Phycisphaerales bacterium]|nr:30S ribosomal protein S17 [Phycisphaerales bacterium]